ncbi:unnamed protein product [Phaeothamnion confervicola]
MPATRPSPAIAHTSTRNTGGIFYPPGPRLTSSQPAKGSCATFLAQAAAAAAAAAEEEEAAPAATTRRCRRQRWLPRAAAWHLGNDFSVRVNNACHEGVARRLMAGRLFEEENASSPSTACEAFVCVDELVVMTTAAAAGGMRTLRLGADARRVAAAPNAGGRSVVSEALSVEYFARRFGGHDVLCEMEISYWSPQWKKIDFIATIKDYRGGSCNRVGVSVTRAMGWPSAAHFTADSARRLLRKKLYGLVVARDGVSSAQRYTGSVLHVWCQNRRIAELMRQAFRRTARELSVTGNVLMLLTVAADLPAVFEDDFRLLGMAAPVEAVAAAATAAVGKAGKRAKARQR